MLVEFRVKNFKSIRDEQVLSMVANSDTTHEETHVVSSKENLRLLKSAVVYGANASGKSNLVNAFFYMRSRVIFDNFGVSTHSITEQSLSSLKFKLDENSKDKASEFEVIYMEDGVRYQYGFALVGDKITEEWLLVYKSDKPQEWFSRKNTEAEGEVYKFSSYLKGPKKTWQKSARANALFLSTAVRLNSLQLQPIYNWFLSKTKLLPSQKSWFSDDILKPLNDESFRHNMLACLAAADLSICDIKLVTEKRSVSNFNLLLADGDQPPFVKRTNEEAEVTRPIFIHKSNDDSLVAFEMQEESAGTRRFFFLALRILGIIKNGSLIVIDELESSLHPLLLEFVIKLFNSEQNKNGAQIVFTTHQSNLLDTNIFRRDQIWFVEKDDTQATTLYPLTDFSPRKKEALESGYLSGRFGGIPFLSDFEICEKHDGA